MPSNLFKKLAADKVDSAELQQLLLTHFESARYLEDGAEYRRAGKVMLRIQLSKKGKITDIVCTSDLSNGDVVRLAETIKAELLQRGPQKVGRRYLFTDQPVTGFFRYDDLFQILPVPQHAPKPPADGIYMQCHPFILEYKYEGSNASWINALRDSVVERRYIALFNALCRHPISRPRNVYQQTWVMLPNRPLDPQIAEIGPSPYNFANAPAIGDDFLPVEGIDAIRRLPVTKYYSQSGSVVNEPLDLPEDIEDSIKRYVALEDDQKRQYERACHWFQHAQNIWSTSPSAAVISFVVAIESLRLNNKPEYCKCCGQITGVTKEFKKLVETLVPGADKLKLEFYNTRSALAHGNELLPIELKSFAVAHNRNNSMLGQLAHIVQLALHNWLLPQYRHKNSMC